ncbi:MAG: hypothetical protein ACOX6I_03215 [Syntrophomonadaceae bacterium]
MAKGGRHRPAENHRATYHQENKSRGLDEFEGRTCQELLEKGKSLYQAALSIDEDAVEEAYTFLERAREKCSENTLLNAYYAASTILMSNFARSLVETGKMVYKSLNILDESVALEDSVEIRKLRGYLCLNLPTHFNRIGTAIEDLRYLQSYYQNNPDRYSAQDYEKVSNDLIKAQEIQKTIPPHIQKLMDGFSNRYKKSADSKNDTASKKVAYSNVRHSRKKGR